MDGVGAHSGTAGGRGGTGRTSDARDLEAGCQALPLCASKHAHHHVCFVQAGCQRSDRTEGKAGLCRVVRSLDVSELYGKRWTACRSVSSGRSGGEHTCLGDMEFLQIFQEGCLPLTAPRLPPGLVRVFTLLFQQCGAWGPYPDFTWEKAGAEQGRCGLGSGLKPGVREALGWRVTPASPCRPLGPNPNGRSVRPVQALAETLALSPRLPGSACTPCGASKHLCRRDFPVSRHSPPALSWMSSRLPGQLAAL